MKRSVLLTLVALAFILPSCAKKQFPPGGPEDKTPPEIISTEPENGSVGVHRMPVLTFTFSERMDRKRIGEAIFVSPPAEIRTDWKKNNLKISFRDSLASDKTYLVTIGSGASDMHRNSMAGSTVLAFSTGESLDSGMISGVVRDQGKPASNMTIAAYHLSFADSHYVFSSVPEYLTQSGTDGEFRFGFLSSGDYLLFAFDDRNHDRTWNPPNEKIGFPKMPAIIGSRQTIATGIDFDMFQRDTLPLRISNAEITRDRVLQVELSERVLKRDLPGSVFSLLRLDRPDTIMLDRLFAWEDSAKTIDILLPDLGESSEFMLSVDSLKGVNGNSISVDDDSVIVQWPTVSDKNPPEIVTVEPATGTRGVSTSPTFCIRHNEPIRLAGERIGFWLYDPDSTMTICRHEQIDPFTVCFTPDDTLSPDVWYDASFSPGVALDLAGNRPPDSAINYTYETIKPDSLGSFSGEVSFRSFGSGQIPMIFYAAIPRGEWTKLEFDPSGRFRHEVEPGKYHFTGFIDRDGDGFFSAGQLDPFEYAEPVLVFGDTITVRSRFETEDIELTID